MVSNGLFPEIEVVAQSYYMNVGLYKPRRDY